MSVTESVPRLGNVVSTDAVALSGRLESFDERRRRIGAATDDRSKSREFEPDKELDDRLEAEAQFDRCKP
jgi:hypothetical protein